MRSVEAWARSEFGGTRLGDARRTKRLVRLAAEVAARPAGMVTRACRSSASREGAFRLLENSSVHADALREAVEDATASRCDGHHDIFVAVDATSLTFTDGTGHKGLGAVGSWQQGSRGVHAMTALAIDDSGATLGVCAQNLWVREARSRSTDRGHRPPGVESEFRHWLDVMLRARSKLRARAPGCRPWFQLDRGADCWQLFELARREGLLVTVRATHDRRLDGDAGFLWSAVEASPVRATRTLVVPAAPPRVARKRIGKRRVKFWRLPPREARTARVQVRAATVEITMKTLSHRKFVVPLNAVLVREVGRRDDAVEWLLLTTHPIATRNDVLRVVDGYRRRWRVEEFHRTWKRGLCRAEDSQLRSRAAVFKWVTLLATVATRAMRLTQLARTTPDVAATTEFSERELEALMALRQPRGALPGVVPTLGQAVRWIADLGGYTGPSNGPPGSTVIGRGLHDVLIAARAFEFRDQKR